MLPTYQQRPAAKRSATPRRQNQHVRAEASGEFASRALGGRTVQGSRSGPRVSGAGREPAIDLASALDTPGFSIDTFGAILAEQGISIDRLQPDWQADLRYLCSNVAPNLKRRPAFCDEIMRWADRRIKETPAHSRAQDASVETLVRIQKFAVSQLFFPATGGGAARDRWQLFKDLMRPRRRGPHDAPRRAMALTADNLDTSTNGEEFRYAGNFLVIKWLKASGAVSLTEAFKSGNARVDKQTYENRQESEFDTVESFNPRVKDGRLFKAKYRSSDEDKIATGRYLYVLLPDHTLVLAIDLDMPWFYHHSYVNNGLPVVCAGKLSVDQGGKISRLDSESGHYKPESRNLAAAANILRNKGVLAANCRIVEGHTGAKVFDPYKGLAPYRPIDNRAVPAWQADANRLMRIFKNDHSIV